jgi:transcriptional regulator with XRE-family HTH domain
MTDSDGSGATFYFGPEPQGPASELDVLLGALAQVEGEALPGVTFAEWATRTATRVLDRGKLEYALRLRSRRGSANAEFLLAPLPQFGVELRGLRSKRKLTQQALEAQCRSLHPAVALDQSSLSRLESGYALPGVLEFEVLVHVLRVHLTKRGDLLRAATTRVPAFPAGKRPELIPESGLLAFRAVMETCRGKVSPARLQAARYDWLRHRYPDAGWPPAA